MASVPSPRASADGLKLAKLAASSFTRGKNSLGTAPVWRPKKSLIWVEAIRMAMPLVKPDNDHARDEADRGSEAGEAHEEQDESGDDGRVEAGLRRDAGRDAEGHGKRKSDQPDRDAGEQVVQEHLRGVGAQGQNRFGQIRIADGHRGLRLFFTRNLF